MEKQVLFWIFIGIFSLTAFITLLGITGVLKNIKDKYLNALFVSLILEVVAAVLFLFKNTDILATDQSLGEIIQQAGVQAEFPNEQSAQNFIIDNIGKAKEVEPLKKQLDSLNLLLQKLETESQQCSEELAKLNRSFYSKITRLRELINGYDGFINIAFRADEKEEVYELLISLFESLQLVKDESRLYTDGAGTVINKAEVRKIYENFKKRYTASDDEMTYAYILQSDTVQMLQAYLNIINPMKKNS